MCLPSSHVQRACDSTHICTYIHVHAYMYQTSTSSEHGHLCMHSLPCLFHPALISTNSARNLQQSGNHRWVIPGMRDEVRRVVERHSPVLNWTVRLCWSAKCALLEVHVQTDLDLHALSISMHLPPKYILCRLFFSMPHELNLPAATTELLVLERVSGVSLKQTAMARSHHQR